MIKQPDRPLATDPLRAASSEMFFSLFRILLLFSAVSQAAWPAETGLATLLQRADAMKLGNDPGWLALLHYKPTTFTRRMRSQADDAAFFLSPDGAGDAAAELRASLTAMLEPPGDGVHAQCRFPARWHWLKQRLAVDVAHDVRCPQVERWLDAFGAERLVLVFPTMYMNNPGSMFGHTFLRFDNSGSVLLSHALNYAAVDTRQDNPASYVVKGLAGGYSGRFAIRPYFETVQTYSNIENRDIFEYTLDLSPQEIRQLLRHVWELRTIDFDYYFLRENCSFRLLSLLEVVRPETALTSGSHFPLYAVPVDTVRVLESAGMITAVIYRPSLYSRIDHAMSVLPAPGQRAVIELAEGRWSVPEWLQDNPAQAVDVLHTAYDLLAFRRMHETSVAQDLLAARSLLDDQSALITPAPSSPETGHPSARLEFGGGTRQDRDYLSFSVRPGFHELVDSPRGFAPGAEINVLETRLNWFTESESLQLERLRIINVVSLSPLKSWRKPLSWMLDIKFERRYLDPVRSTLPFITRVGAGASAATEHLTVYGMATAEAEYARTYEQNYSLLAGLRVGMILHAGLVRLRAGVESGSTLAGMDRDAVSADVHVQFDIRRRVALRTGYTLTRYDTFDDENVYGRVAYYF